MRHATRRHEEGFTLPLVAALLLVAAMVAATVLQKSNRDEFWNPRVETQKRLQYVSNMLVAYQREHGRLPCPASRFLAYNDANHGEELTHGATGHCTGASEIPGTVRETYTRVGAVPYKTLGLTRDYGEDAWGNKLVYGVTSVYTNPVNFRAASGSEPGIRIRTYHETTPSNTNQSSTVTDNGAFIVLSLGPDAKGAFPANSTASAPPIPCGTSTDGRDVLNCNDTIPVIDRLFFHGSTVNPPGTQHYDDQLVWREVDTQAVEKWAEIP